MAGASDDMGLNAAQVQAFKRAGAWDPDTLAAIPISNLKAMANKLDAKQREMDRQHSLATQGKKPDEGQPAEKAEAEAGTADTPETKQQDGQPSPLAISDYSEKGIADFVMKSIEPTKEESEALVSEFGEDGAKAIRSREQRLVSTVAQAQMQILKPLLSGLMTSLQWAQEAEFEHGVASLKSQPGFESFDASPENLTALRTAADKDIRAKNDPAYRYRDAVKAVASSVFNVDPAMAAQAALARKANLYTSTSGSRPTSANPSPRPTTPEQRALAAAEAAMRGQGVQGVREALSQ